MREYSNENIGYNDIITATATDAHPSTRLFALALAALVERVEALVEVMDDTYNHIAGSHRA